MKIKKLVSFLLAIIIAVTSYTGCFAMRGYSAIPSTDISDDSDDSSVSQEKQKNQEAQAKQDKVIDETREIGETAVDLTNVHEANQKELDDLNKRFLKEEHRCHELEGNVEDLSKALRDWSDDVLCKNCLCCRASDLTVSLKRGDVIKVPSNVIFRSKRFYIGVMVGAVVVTVVLVGAYVCVHFIKK